jgi:uncharacterized membrane protein
MSNCLLSKVIGIRSLKYYMFLFNWMTNKLPRFKLVAVGVVAVAVMLTALGAMMMTLGQQVYAADKNQNNGNNNNQGEHCAPGEIPSENGGCVSCGPGEIQVGTHCEKCPPGTFANGCCKCDPELPEGSSGFVGETQLHFVSANMANSISSLTGIY